MGEARSMCPHCGYDFAADAPILRGRWKLTPTAAYLDGSDCYLTRSQAGVLYSIAKADGEWVSTEALLNRNSYSESPNIVAVFVSQIRRKLGDAMPVESRRGYHAGGYRWAPDARLLTTEHHPATETTGAGR